MNHTKRDLFYVDASELTLGLDFEVITDTPFHEGRVTHFYAFENHDLDAALADLLHLGIVRNLHLEDDYYMYNASNDPRNNVGLINEITRIEVYYQLTHPAYTSAHIKDFILGTEIGKELLKSIQTTHTDALYLKLKELFTMKNNHIIPIRANMGSYKG